MKKSFLRIILFAMLLAAGVVSMSSCNKGYGCPTNFSVGMAEMPVQVSDIG